MGGVSPGKGGKMHLELPVFDSVKEVYILHCQIMSNGIMHINMVQYGARVLHHS